MENYTVLSQATFSPTHIRNTEVERSQRWFAISRAARARVERANSCAEGCVSCVDSEDYCLDALMVVDVSF